MGENDTQIEPNRTRPLDGVGIWGGGFTGGLIGGIAMGLVLHFGADLIELLGGLAPVPGTAVGTGWMIHMILSVLFGLVFGVVASSPSVQQLIDSFADYVIVGLVFAAVIGLLAGGFLFPLAMGRADVASLPLPFLPVPGAAGELFSALLFALGHVVYGLVLGAVFATINGVVPRGVAEYSPLER